MRIKKEQMRLYAITDRSWLNGRTLADQVEEALKGGATIIQLREKGRTKEQIIQTAKEIKPICEKYQVPLIMNDSVELAKLCDADGVHLGQKDMNADEARQILGDDKIIGVSARTVEQAKKAVESGADYLGVGAVFPTSTKLDAVAVSNETIRSIREAVDIPIVAIGGISEENVLKLAGSKINGVAVISALFAKEDIELATRNLKELVMKVVD